MSAPEWFRNAAHLQRHGRDVHGWERRRHRRLRGPAGRLDYLEGLGVDAALARPVTAVAEPRRRLRHRRLLRHRSALRLERRLRRVPARGRGPRHPRACSTSSSTTPPTGIPGSSTRASDPSSRYRDWYVWSKKRPPTRRRRGLSSRACRRPRGRTRNARACYFHRFYDFQPDLNIDNPEVREEIRRIIGYWLSSGLPASASTPFRS